MDSAVADAAPEMSQAPAETVEAPAGRCTPPVTDANEQRTQTAPRDGAHALAIGAAGLRRGVDVNNTEDRERTVVRCVHTTHCTTVTPCWRRPGISGVAVRNGREACIDARLRAPGERPRARDSARSLRQLFCGETVSLLLSSPSPLTPRRSNAFSVVADDRPGLLLDVTELLKAQQARWDFGVLCTHWVAVCVSLDSFGTARLPGDPSQLSIMEASIKTEGSLAGASLVGAVPLGIQWSDHPTLRPNGASTRSGRVLCQRCSDWRKNHWCVPCAHLTLCAVPALGSPTDTTYRVSSFRVVSEARVGMLKESLERQCVPAVQPNAGWELNQHLGDTATLRAHIMAREQWEIDRSALEVNENACLGRGSFGEVHRGTWRGTEVAVKRLRADMASERELLEFRRELAIVNHLAHPNIVQFLGACTTSVPLCIVTEFMQGGNLADLLAARGEGRPFPLGRALNWALDTAKGMRYLHERRPTMIIHRDLKPENLLLDDAGRIKITDFGLSKSAMQLRGERSRSSEEQTVSRTTCGTWLYTAPEVYKKEPYSAKVDQFAFGMILYELLHGCAPFKHLSPEETTVQLAMGHRPEVSPNIRPELRDLVVRCWAHDPSVRPSFADIQRILQNVLASLQPGDFEDRVALPASIHEFEQPAQHSTPAADAREQSKQCGCTIA